MLFLERLTLRINNFLLWIAGSAVSVIMLLVIGNMVVRSIYRPFSATYEVVAFLSTIVVAFALGASQIKKVHVTVDMLSDKLPLFIRKQLGIIINLLSILLFSMVTWQLVLYASRLHQRSYMTDSLKLPLAPLVYAVAFGFAFFSFILIVDLLKILRGDHK